MPRGSNKIIWWIEGLSLGIYIHYLFLTGLLQLPCYECWYPVTRFCCGVGAAPASGQTKKSVRVGCQRFLHYIVTLKWKIAPSTHIRAIYTVYIYIYIFASTARPAPSGNFGKKNRVTHTVTKLCHSFRHLMWKYIWHIFSDIFFWFLCDILFWHFILAFHLAPILTSHLASYLASILTFSLAFYLAFFLIFSLASILTFFLAPFLTFYLAFYLTFNSGILSGIYSDIIFCHSIWHSLWHSFWHSIWHWSRVNLLKSRDPHLTWQVGNKTTIGRRLPI